MDAVQVFNWFCKEQKIIPLIRKMFYTIQPSTINYKDNEIIHVYLGYEEWMNRKGENGLLNLFDWFLNCYACKVGWDKYYDILNEKKINNLLKRWNYFISNNVFVSNINIGDKIYYATNEWSDGHGFRLKKNIGKVKEINILGYSLRVEDESGRVRTVYHGQLKSSSIKFEYFIKRKKKKYYGVDKK